MFHARKITLTFSVMYLSRLKPKTCAGHNSYTVAYKLIIFGNDICQISRSAAWKKDNSCFVFFLVISPEQIS